MGITQLGGSVTTSSESKTDKGILFILRNIFNAVISPQFLDPTLARVRATSLIESGTVTTFSTVTGVTNLGNYSANSLMEMNNFIAWQGYRNLII